MRKALLASTALIAFAAPQGTFAACQGENTGNVLCDAAHPATAGTLATSFGGATTVNVNAGAAINVSASATVTAPGALVFTHNDPAGIAGISARNDFGAINVTSNGAILTGGLTALDNSAASTSPITVTANQNNINGNVSVQNAGSGTTTVTTNGIAGTLNVSGHGANSSVLVNGAVNGGILSTGGAVVAASLTGSGNATVTTAGAVSGTTTLSSVWTTLIGSNVTLSSSSAAGQVAFNSNGSVSVDGTALFANNTVAGVQTAISGAAPAVININGAVSSKFRPSFGGTFAYGVNHSQDFSSASASTTLVTNGPINVDTVGGLISFGAAGAGINATGTGVGGLSVTSNGAITVTDNNAASGHMLGINAVFSGNASGTGALAITANGNITVSSINGIAIRASTAGLGSLSVTNNGVLQLLSDFQPVGINASIGNAANTSALSIRVQNNIGAQGNPTAQPAALTFGVQAQHNGTGDINIDVLAGIVTTGSAIGVTRGGAGVGNAFITVASSGVLQGAFNAILTSGGSTTVTDFGTITGTGGRAIQFGGANNTLTLAPGAVINGSVLGTGSDTFQLGGSGTGVFNANLIGAGQQYTGFVTFNKVGDSTWTLTGSGAQSWTINGGTLALAAGASIGGSVLNNATFTSAGTVSDGLTNNGIVNANGGAINGAIANNASATFNVGGTVTSNSTFTNAAGATLAIGGGGAYTLQGLLSNGGTVTVASGGQLVATASGITNAAGGSITVAAGGTVKDDLNNAGAVANSGAYIANIATNTGAGSITNTAAGTWTGNVLGNAAVITNNGAWTGNVVSNTGTINNNLTWTGTVTNAGTFNNAAGATVSGLFTNTAGTVVNNGALNGGVTVTGGTLTGSGTATNVTINAGIFAPGNGTPGSSMTVTGNLVLQSAAQYLVQLNPATSSFASVGGTATLGGATVNASFATGTYVAKQYTIVNATGGVIGTFSGPVNTNLPGGFKSSLSYGGNNAFLNLTLDLTPKNPTPNFGNGLNVNQQNVATALTNFFNSTGRIPMVFGALSPAGLTQVSGELPTASQQTTFDAMNLFMGLLTDPFIAGRGDPVNASASAPQFAAEDEAVSAYAANSNARTKSERDAYAAVYRKAPIAPSFEQRWSVWSAGYGGSQTTDGNTVLGSNNTRSSIGGVAVGADYRFSPNTLAGFAVAGGGTSFSINGLGSGRSDLFQAGAFIRHTVGPAYISAALAYGWQDITTDRTVTVAGTDLLHANFNANAYSGRVEGGYRFVAPWMSGIGVTPYAAGQFTTFDLPAYAEQAIAGANTFALSYMAKSVTDTRSELGLRSDKSFAVQNGIFTLRGRAAWAHDFNPDRNIGATFQTLPGASFVVNGATHAADSALVTASAEMKWLNGFSLAGTFEGQFSNVTTSYAGKGVVRYAW
ncbi:MAG TPA: autotransporter domain-containing protein [Bradyrhizobium sp.]|nr:autotransporter domain-containing protein [Bradyrhizobium sp.]